MRSVRTLLTAALLGAGLAVAASPTAHAANTPLPAHVFAPYFEAYSSDNPATLATASGAKYESMAFIQAATKGSCTAYWNGSTSQPINSSTFGSAISTMQANGGDVIPSFGGYTADNTGTEIADSCTNVNSIAQAYESVVTTYGVTRIDLDTEDNSLTNSAGIDRRNKAIAQVESWAAANGRTVQFSYTLPTTTSGLASSGLAVLQNAVSNNARVDVVNIMAFDYYDGATHHMGTDAENAATGLEGQLAQLYPGKTAAQLWSMVGITLMPGIDDYGAAETTTVADASTVESWAANKGLAELSFWAMERDNGGCVGTGGSDTCSGIAQNTWDFSHTLEPFTSGGGGTTQNDFSVGVSPSSASVAQGGSASATVSTAVTSGSAQSVSLSASGAPSGVSVSFSPASVTAGGSSTMSVTVGASVAAGSYPITVTGTAASGSHTASYTLTVTSTGGGGGGGGGSLVNGNFETGSLSPWTCTGTSGVVSSPVHSGSHALLVVPSASSTGECDQAVTLAPNTAYTLSGWVNGPYAYVGVSGGASASTWSSSSSWNQLTVHFTTGSSGTVTVYVHGWYAQGNVSADDFSLS